MKNGIRILRQEQNIALWSNQVQECNSSGLSVAKWCRENKIPASKYMNRQRKVFEGQPIKFCVNNNPSSNKRILDCGAIRLSDLPRVNSAFLSAECYARRA